jgi:hypothetical protein
MKHFPKIYRLFLFNASLSAFVSRFVIYWIYVYLSMLGGTGAWPEFYMAGFL